jgi:hypothetical protein
MLHGLLLLHVPILVEQLRFQLLYYIPLLFLLVSNVCYSFAFN